MITSEEMRQLEENSGISKQNLMENAGKAVYEELKKRADISNKNILVVAYHGNNGGDGFVAARHLCETAEVDILFIGNEEKMKKETLLNYRKLSSNERVQFIDDETVDFNDYDVIIDAILGIGIRGRINREISAIIDDINNSKAFKLSVDIPTGLNPDTGEIIEKCINPDLVVTFHDLKPGLEKIKDKVAVVDIGLRR